MRERLEANVTERIEAEWRVVSRRGRVLRHGTCLLDELRVPILDEADMPRLDKGEQLEYRRWTHCWYAREAQERRRIFSEQSAAGEGE